MQMVNASIYERWYRIVCPKCYVQTKAYRSEAEAVEAWNKAMGSAEKSSTVERTAKVKERFMLVTGGMGDTLSLCECGFIVSDKWTYCPSCGARLEWE